MFLFQAKTLPGRYLNCSILRDVFLEVLNKFSIQKLSPIGASASIRRCNFKRTIFNIHRALHEKSGSNRMKISSDPYSFYYFPLTKVSWDSAAIKYRISNPKCNITRDKLEWQFERVPHMAILVATRFIKSINLFFFSLWIREVINFRHTTTKKLREKREYVFFNFTQIE